MKTGHFSILNPNSSTFPKCTVSSLLNGEWERFNRTGRTIPDPLTGNGLFEVQLVQPNDLVLFGERLRGCPSYGRHNPIYNVGRYVMLGEVFRRVADALVDPHIAEFFARLIQRCMPKSWPQCLAEVKVTAAGFANFSGDNVRFLARGFSVPGDRDGQESCGYRWPFGPVVIIAPFNFPLEIPALQLLGALAMGNFPLLKADSRVAIVMEQFLRLMIACGLPAEDVDMICCSSEVMGQFIEQNANAIRLCQFTGSSKVAEWLSRTLNGRVRIEDAGFDWKILGPDADPNWLDYVAWQSDQDAYAASGQKCSAQSLLLVHNSWMKLGLIEKIRELAERRRLEDLTIGPVLSWNTGKLIRQIETLKILPGATLLFGGQKLTEHSIPQCYGAITPTAVQVPIEVLINPQLFNLITTEVFGPVQVVVEYGDADLPAVLDTFERLQNRLTAAVVSADKAFINRVLGATTNGTTYEGMRARTTGAPQNHWFGPCGDPRAAGIGTREAIINTWSCHREVIHDHGPLEEDWTIPAPS